MTMTMDWRRTTSGRTTSPPRRTRHRAVCRMSTGAAAVGIFAAAASCCCQILLLPVQQVSSFLLDTPPSPSQPPLALARRTFTGPSAAAAAAAASTGRTKRQRQQQKEDLLVPPLRMVGLPNPEMFETDDQWHPRDPAFTTPQLLSGIWHQIAQAGTMVKGETMTVVYPQMEEEINKPQFLSSLFGHLDYCKDVCDHFGITTTLVPYKEKVGNKIVGFTSKSFKSNNQLMRATDGDGADEGGDGEYDFGYDPFWDDGTDFDALYKNIDDEYEDFKSQKDIVNVQIENPVPKDDEEIVEITKNWVNKVMADMGICPFTQDATRAGLPLGDVFYEVDRSSTVEDVYAKYWQEVVRIEQNKEKDISTSLLILPEFNMDNVELFESFSTTLTNALTVLDVEELMQLVFFHPHWSFRDGGARASSTGQDDPMAANYARRSPWPMINLLRTKQVRAAQKGIPTGLVYKQNEKTLAAVGSEKLETMLRLRDWSDIADFKVNRREMDALKIAQDYQKTGSVASQELSLDHDATPAANKVDRRQVEEGDLVNVLLQALGKRLGKIDGGKPIQPLTGPETSASSMAVDFLIQELDSYASGAAPAVAKSPVSSAAAAAPVAPAVATATKEESTAPVDEQPQGAPVVDQRQARMEAARKALMADLYGEEEAQELPPGYEDQMKDVYFGKGGIKTGGEDENTTMDIDLGSF